MADITIYICLFMLYFQKHIILDNNMFYIYIYISTIYNYTDSRNQQAFDISVLTEIVLNKHYTNSAYPVLIELKNNFKGLRVHYL